MKQNFTRTKWLAVLVIVVMTMISPAGMLSQQSVARQWNECQLNCIRKYGAKPTVHARHLLHASIVMYDAWAVYSDHAQPFFLGNTWGDFTCEFNGIPMPEDGDLVAAQEKAISYAMFRTLWNRYTIFAPGANLLTIQGYINAQMAALGYNPLITSTDYSDGDPAKLGNYIAAKMQQFALQDGSNQQLNYANQYYQPINGQIEAQSPGNPNVVDPNRWQSLVLDQCFDQSTGLPVDCPPGSGAPALSPEWGDVVPFALLEEQATIITRDGDDYKVYLDPGAPPYLDTTLQAGLDESFFKWGYVMNIIWHSFHNNDDGVMIDASPNSIGGLNITDDSQLPVTFEEYQAFYDLYNGGVHDPGHTINPVTGLPYEVQMVPRKDFTRVLSQFWADGPNSETPPGHWFKLFNDVDDHPMLEKRWMGEGEILSDLEWDVRGYFALGGGIHDAAIACWGAKGAYDYTRPIMAIRWMGVKGQCTDPNLPHYHPAGLPLIPGYIELVQSGDPLAGANDEHVNKIKVYSWRGPVIATGVDGAGWLLAENWWTYQTAGFVTPPFPGYYSGHSTYSRTGAEVMTLITGDEYFPGGYAEYLAPAETYLLADDGPSVDVKLQWATYRDASDQCSASRIYGGLHPPQDDIPGRKVGLVVGPQAFNKANAFIQQDPPRVDDFAVSVSSINDAAVGSVFTATILFDEMMNTAVAPNIVFVGGDGTSTLVSAGGEWQPDAMTYVANFNVVDANVTVADLQLSVNGAQDLDGNNNVPGISGSIMIDTQNPSVNNFISDISDVINDEEVVSAGSISMSFTFSEMMDVASTPSFTFASADAESTLMFNAGSSSWSVDQMTYSAVFDLVDANVEADIIDVETATAMDMNGNAQVMYAISNATIIDTKNPSVQGLSMTTANISDADAGSTFEITLTFDEAMDNSSTPQIIFPEGGVGTTLWLNEAGSMWVDDNSYMASYFVVDNNVDLSGADIQQVGLTDEFGNEQIVYASTDAINIDTHNPEVLSVVASEDVVADDNDGGILELTFSFDDEMDTDVDPVISFANGDPLANTLTATGGNWENNQTYVATYSVADANEELMAIEVMAASAIDDAGNTQTFAFSAFDVFSIDTKNPEIVIASANTYNVTSANAGANGFTVITIFDEVMAESSAPVISFPVETPPLTPNVAGSGWLSPTTYKACFDVPAGNLVTLADIDVAISGAGTDAAGNLSSGDVFENFFSINMIVSVSDLENQNAFVVYPNPVSQGQSLNIQWDQVPTGLNIAVYNAVGQMVMNEFSTSAGEKLVTLNTSGLGQGMYYVHVNTDNGSGVFTVSVTR